MPLIVTVKLSRVWIKSETVHDCESSKHNYSSPKPLLFALGYLFLSFDVKICDPVFTRKQQLLSLQKLQKAHKIWSYSPRELPYSVWTILDQFKRRVQFPCGHAWLTIKLALMKETILLSADHMPCEEHCSGLHVSGVLKLLCAREWDIVETRMG